MANTANLELVISLKDQASKGLGGISKSVGALGTAVGVFAGGAALAGVTALGRAVGDFFSDAITESRDAAKGFAQTEAAIKSTGGAANVTADQIVDLAGSLSKTTLFTDDSIQGLENLMLTFTGVRNEVGAGNDIFTQSTQIALDMATALGTDAAGGAIQLGKALNDPTKGITALTRVGVTFTEQQKNQIKTLQASGDMLGAQKIILAELSKEFGGSAAAAAKADGGFHLFQQRMDDVKQTVGDALMPALTGIMGLMSGPVLDAVEKLGTALAGKLTTAIAWLTTTGIPGAIEVFGSLKKIVALLATGDFSGGIFGLDEDSPLIGFLLKAREGFITVRDAVLTFVQALKGDWVNDSGILPFHAAIGEIGLFISGTVVPAFQSLVGWIKENATLLGQIAVAVGVMIVAFEGISAIVAVVGTVSAAFAGMGAAVTAAGGVIGAIVAVLGGPVTIAIGAVALAVGLLALAWQTDFLGIQTTLTAWWTSTGQPIFTELTTWLGTNIPVAIGVLVGFWNSTLLPAIQAVGMFIQSTVVPAFVTLGQWLGTNIPIAITALAGFWNSTLLPALTAVGTFITGTLVPTLTTLATGAMTAVGTAATTLAGFWNTTLLPALTAVWSFVQTSVIPLFDALANVTMAALNLAVTAAAGLWQNVLQPALSAVWSFISSSLQPVIQSLADFFTGTLSPAVTDAGNTLSDVLGPAVTAVTGFFGGLYTAIGGISGVISTVIGHLNSLADTLSSLKLPPWLTPGSPTPFEYGLRGIADAAYKAAGALGGLGSSLSSIGAKFTLGMGQADLRAMPDVIAAMRKSTDSMIQEIIGFLDDPQGGHGPYTQAGIDAINAFIAGMNTKLSSIQSGSGGVAAAIQKLLATGDFAGGIFGKDEDDPFIEFLLRARTDATALANVLDVLKTGDFKGGILGLSEDDPFILALLKAADAAKKIGGSHIGPANTGGSHIGPLKQMLDDIKTFTTGMGMEDLRKLPDIVAAMRKSTDSTIQEIIGFLDDPQGGYGPFTQAGIDAINAFITGMSSAASAGMSIAGPKMANDFALIGDAATVAAAAVRGFVKASSGVRGGVGTLGGPDAGEAATTTGGGDPNATFAPRPGAPAGEGGLGASVKAGSDAGVGYGDAFRTGLEQSAVVIQDTTRMTFQQLQDVVILPWQADTRTFFGGAGFGFIGAASEGIMSAAGGMAQVAGAAGGMAGSSLVSTLSSAAAGVGGVVGQINNALGSIERNITITITTVHREVTAP